MVSVALLVLAGAAVAFLAAVLFFGSTRRTRLRSFVERIGGAWSWYDDFDLQPALDTLYEPETWWVGAAGRLSESPWSDAGEALYLLELHRRPEGPPGRTAVLVESPHNEQRPRLVTERTPDGDDAGRFRVDPELRGDEPLADRLDALPTDRDWLLTVRFRAGRLLVASRDRTLSDDAEWRELLDATATIAGSGPPA